MEESILADKLNSNIWMTEQVSPSEMYLSEVEEIIYKGKSTFQDLTVVKLFNGNKAFYLDNQLQSTTFDEYIYHELLVHFPFIIHQNPKSVLIIGAGEGASAREALKWKNIATIKLIELDPEVINCCKKYLPEMNKGAYEHNKVSIEFMDAMAFINNCKEKYDVIICDLCDQDLDRNLIINLEFLQSAKKLLNNKGNILIQSGEMPFQQDETFLNYIKMLKSTFKNIKILTTWIPSYCRNWAYVLLQDDEIRNFSEDEIKEIIHNNITDKLFFINEKTYLGIFNPPKYVQDYEK